MENRSNNEKGKIIASFLIKPAQSMEKTIRAVENFASVSSSSNTKRMLEILKETKCLDLKDDIEKRVERFYAKVLKIVPISQDRESKRQNRFVIELAIPIDTVDLSRGGVPHLLILFAGDIFRTKEVEEIKWFDISFPPDYLYSIKDMYLFNWYEIPGNDDGLLKEFLTKKFDTDWVKIAKIEKIDDGNTIRVTAERNFLSLKLNYEKSRVNLKINDDRINELIVRNENGKLNIYKDILGPKFGVNGIKEHFFKEKKDERPLIATIIQPNIGLNDDECACISKHLADAGSHIIVEDEILGSFFGLENDSSENRIEKVAEALEKINKPVIYFTNAIGWMDSLNGLKKKIKDWNSEKKKNVLVGVQIDPFACGFSVIKEFRESVECPIFAHIYMNSFFIKDPNFGISTFVLMELSRIAGADICYIGNVGGRFISEDPAYLKRGVVDKMLKGDELEPIYPAVCGKINPRNIIMNIRCLGEDIVLQAASGIFDHKMGPEMGVETFKQVIDLAIKKCKCCRKENCYNCENLIELIKDNKAVRVAFEDGLPSPGPCDYLKCNFL